VSLIYARVSNVVVCDKGHFINPRKIALDFEGARTGSVFMRNGFEADGEVKFYTAVINGTLQCDRGHFVNPGATALNLEAATSGQVLLWNEFAADGAVNLSFAVINNAVSCGGGHFTNPSDIALNFESAKTGSVFMENGFRAEGEVKLLNAVVDGWLNCDGAQLINPGAIALNLEHAKTGSVLLRGGFKAEGEVRLFNAVVDGNVECDGAQLINPGAIALHLEHAKTGNVLLRNGFRAEGEVMMLNAVVDGSLDCSRGHFSNPDQFAINATAVHIQDHVIFEDGFGAERQVIFRNAEIGQAFRLLDCAWDENARLDLRSAKVKTLLNDQKGWPRRDGLFLHGFTFDQLDAEAELTARSQINWIRRQPRGHFISQPYEQTAAVLRDMGLQEEATKVMIAKNEEHGRHSHGFKEVIWYNLFGPFIGFGYHPWNAFYWSLAVILIGYLLFSAGREGGIMIPTKSEAYKKKTPLGTGKGHIVLPTEGPAEISFDYRLANADQEDHVSELYPKFNAFIYSLERSCLC